MHSPEPYPRIWCVIAGRWGPGNADACGPSPQAHIRTRVLCGPVQPKDGEVTCGARILKPPGSVSYSLKQPRALPEASKLEGTAFPWGW